MNVEKDKMAIPDLFFMEIIKVPGYESRIKCLYFLGEYKEESDKIKTSLSDFAELCDR